MISRDLKLYLVLVCIPAVLFTGAGFFYLHRVAAMRQAASVIAREGVIERIQAHLREAFFDEEKAEGTSALEGNCETLMAALAKEESVRPAAGVFVWKPRAGFVCARTVPAAVSEEIRSFRAIGDWAERAKNSKKPPMAGVRLCAAHPVVWARDGKRNGSVCGVVFAEDPVVGDFLARALWPIGFVIGLLLAGVLSAGTVLLVRAAAKARKDALTKTTFLSNASHELKTPLAAIGLWAEMLKNHRLAPARQEHAYKTIVDENARMVRLVENLLDFSRLEQGRRRYRFCAVDLAVLAADTIDLVRENFAAHGISLVAPEAAITAWADEDAVKQILMNLLGNAAKYAAAMGPVEVAVARAGERVRVAVADCGPGLSEEARAHVFERFWRAETALTSNIGGLGLGLAISDALAKDMDGLLSVEPRPEGGAVFTLDLPARE